MGKGAPPADPNIGRAAMLSAETGQDYLAFMRGQSAITNEWATEDRARSIDTFRPLEDAYIAEAQTYDSPERQERAAAEAAADASLGAAQQSGTLMRGAMASGVNPNSGRFINAARKSGDVAALNAGGARNIARRQIRQQGEGMRANAVNMGRGLAINPATSAGLSSGAMSSGFSGAMQGYNQQGSLLNTQHQQQMDAWEANQGMLGGIGSAIGTVIGAFSSKDAKTDKKPVKGNLRAIKMLDVESWKYKDGFGDKETHVGPYAEDFQRATGLGDGRSIKFVDSIGVTMGAVKEIANKLDKIERKLKVAA